MTLVLILFCLLLLLLSAFFSASETALMSLSRTDLKRLSESDAIGHRVCRLLRRPQRLLRTILVGNMFVNVLFASLFATLLNGLLSSGNTGIFERFGSWLFPTLGTSGIHRFGSICRMILNIVIVTPALMLFGEQTPKVVAFSRNIAVSRLAAYPLTILGILLTPFNILLRFISNLFLQLMGQNTSDRMEKMTADELISTITVSEESGATSESENQILSRIVDFGGTCIDEVMTPRTQIIGMDDRMTLSEAYDIARRKGHSWYPVYQKNLDGIWGLLSLVDYPFWEGRPEMNRPLSQFRSQLTNLPRTQQPLHKPKYVPVTAHIDSLLNSMQQEARSVIVIVDEHGGFEGMATLNDIVAELLGTLPDHENPQVEQHDNILLVDGSSRIRLLQKQFGEALDMDEEESVTLGGVIMSRLGHIPAPGDTVTLDNGTQLLVKTMDGNRVASVEIRWASAQPAGGMP